MAGFKQGGIEFKQKSVIGNPTTSDHIIVYWNNLNDLVIKTSTGQDVIATESLLSAISGNLQAQLDDLDLNYATDAQLQSVSGGLQVQIDNNYSTIQTVSGNLQAQITNLEFVDLIDTPPTYSGADTNVLTVSAGQIVFTPQSEITPTLTEAQLSGALDGRYMNVTGDIMTGNFAVSGAQAYSVNQSLTSGTTINTDCDTGNVHTVTLDISGATLANPTNLKDGSTYMWIIKQDGIGGWTLSYGSAFKFPSGTAPTLTAISGSVDILSGVSDGSNLYCNMVNDFK